MHLSLFWLDTGWGCGGVFVDSDGIIRESCPIFGKFRGQRISDLIRKSGGKYKTVACGEQPKLESRDAYSLVPRKQANLG